MPPGRAWSCWVRAEVALLHGDVSQALVAARESIRLARVGRSVRHGARGLLFASVCRAGIGWPGEPRMRRGSGSGWSWSSGVLSVELISAALPEPLAGPWRAGADVRRLLQRAARHPSHPRPARAAPIR